MKRINLNIFNQDFKDFINALNEFDVDYLLIGGYAVIIHGYNRTTGDMDIWVRKNKPNYVKLSKALDSFGIPSEIIGENRFLNAASYDVFTFGRPPVAIDIVTEIQGVDFEEAYNNKNVVEIDNQRINLINIEHLIQTKKKVGRFKDLDDLENLKP